MWDVIVLIPDIADLIFYAKVKFGNLDICMEKVKIIYFSKTIAAHDLKVGSYI